LSVSLGEILRKKTGEFSFCYVKRSLRAKSKGEKSSVFEEVKKKGTGSQGKMEEEGKDNDMLISVDNGIKWKLKDLWL